MWRVQEKDALRAGSYFMLLIYMGLNEERQEGYSQTKAKSEP